jgi:hypothetical protein
MNVTSNRNFFDGQCPIFGSAFAPDFTISPIFRFLGAGYKKIF